MKRYNIYCFGAEPDEVVEAPDGDWVRYEDAEAMQRVAESAQVMREVEAEYRAAVEEALTERETRLSAAQAAAQRSHAELEALKARVTRAVTVLSTPGTWSEFAQKALKELRGG